MRAGERHKRPLAIAFGLMVAFFLIAPYGEGLFLLLTILAFWGARRDRWWLAGLAGAAAAATRSVGILLVPALLVEAGIPPAAVITIATRNGATALGWEATRGAARPGMRADLVVLTADPLADIRNTRAIETVWLAGTPYRPDSLLAAAGVGEVAR